MADLDNGYTRIANEILEAMARIKLSPTQYRILFVVWRYTYGFQRKEHKLSLTFLTQATGCDRRLIQREIKKLIKTNILVETFGVRKIRIVGFNKNCNEWIHESTIGEIDNGVLDKCTIGEIDKCTIGGIDKEERKNLKEKDKENISYKSVYEHYLSLNLTDHKQYTPAMANAIKKAMSENKYTIEECKTLLDRHKQVVELTKESGYKVPARTLQVFFGQKVQHATHLICSEYEEGGKKYQILANGGYKKEEENNGYNFDLKFGY